ncbi:hypothetical protein KK101_08895, partial [Curtobacterium flaccumfaciens pv. oortii]|uniref:hypothetical protein n=1 Tax=Curtobacterium flaccumfaciens TaxID=2035 RepID=UPI001BDE1F4F
MTTSMSHDVDVVVGPRMQLLRTRGCDELDVVRHRGCRSGSTDDRTQQGSVPRAEGVRVFEAGPTPVQGTTTSMSHDVDVVVGPRMQLLRTRGCD